MKDEPLIEGRDFYLEHGYLVFTASYLLQKDRCCGSGCRHCPYIPRHAGEQARAPQKGAEPAE